MTSVTTTLWTCARCGAEETVDGSMKQPDGWVRAFFATPPRSGVPTAIGDLCNPCGGYLVSFVNGTEVEDIARDAVVARRMREFNAEMQWLGKGPA